MSEVRRQARGENRRREVLDAALRVLARHGPRGVTHRAVAAEGGTSLRATTYYFASRAELLTEALRHHADKALERLEALRIPLPEDPEQAIVAAAEMLTEMVIATVALERDGLVAEYELVLEIGRDPRLEPAYAACEARIAGILTGYAEHFGASDPGADARIVLATFRGLQLEALSRPSAVPDSVDVGAVFQRLLRSLYESRRR